MRRNDREVTEETEIRKVLDECKSSIWVFRTAAVFCGAGQLRILL